MHCNVINGIDFALNNFNRVVGRGGIVCDGVEIFIRVKSRELVSFAVRRRVRKFIVIFSKIVIGGYRGIFIVIGRRDVNIAVKQTCNNRIICRISTAFKVAAVSYRAVGYRDFNGSIVDG